MAEEKKSLVSYAFSGSPKITSEKLDGKNYLSWRDAVDIWFVGQGLSDHLSTKVSDIDATKRDDWKKVDAQLVSLLWQSIEPSLMLHFRTYKTCYDIWKTAETFYANDVQRLYETARGISSLHMTDTDLPSYLKKAQSLCDEVKLMLEKDDVKEMKKKIDNLLMVLVLHGLHKDYESIRNQTLTNPGIPTVAELIGRLIRVPPPEIDSHTASESSVLASNSFGRGRGRGRGRGGRDGGRDGGRGRGRGNLHCSYCDRDGHTQDRCYHIVGFPNKTATVAQSSVHATEQKLESEEHRLSPSEYKEFLQLKAAQQSSSSATVAHAGNSTLCFSQSAGSWILDSGASDHMAGNPSLFNNLTPPKAPHSVTLADGSKAQVMGIGPEYREDDWSWI
ncbi:uncharacterized protein LOC130723554 isoform X1 [Lotus japonicus]|uniref:uncharacterized protein LOC130723554 isoform X1 n=1 Tax=Lotus japonicus TaxID=34305 RepID=UPI00258445C3|nr:uncharacterized protein LOC130723554 isoform X1 [Lotus japonicus]